MITEPPTIDCPGCGRDLAVEHVRARRIDGAVVYLRAEADTDALLRHWDTCPNVDHTATRRSTVICPGCSRPVAVEHVPDGGTGSVADYLSDRPDDRALLEHWPECPNDHDAP